MRNIRYQYLPPTGPDTIESSSALDKFLLELPHLFYMGYVPSLSVMNLFLSLGVDEAGMSGGAEWQPFVIDEAEYNEVLKSVKRRKYLNVEGYDFSLIAEKLNSKSEWFAKVMEHKLGIPFERHLELMEQEQSLNLQAEEAYESGDKELGDCLHIQWYQAANELNEFCDMYLNT